MNRVQVFAWVLIGVGFCGCAAAADALPPSLRTCMKETDASRRLACFDRESAVLAGESAPVARQIEPVPARPAAATPAAPVASAAATGAATATAAAATAQSAEDKFGYRGNMARADLDKQKQAEQQGFEALTAKVAEVSALAHGELLVTLDNGQIWQQKTADRGMRLKVGDQVTIKRGVLNSFLLTSDASKGSMRVARVR